MNDQLMNDLLERFQNRFYGKYRGTVTSVDAATFRIKAKVPSVLGEQETGWCWPCVPYAGNQVGIAFLPEEGSGVWIEFENGDVSYPIWVGCYWNSGELPSDATDTAKAIVTKSGHKLVFDDSAMTITITDATGNKITLSPDGIKLECQSNTIEVIPASVNINDTALQILPG